MLFPKNKKTINKINKLSVSCERCMSTISASNIFLLHLDKSFTEDAKSELKPVIQNFILTANKNLCTGCYWLVTAHDFVEFKLYYRHEQLETEKYLMSRNPSISYVKVDSFDIMILLGEINDQTFNTLENTTLPNGDLLLLEVTDAAFTALDPSDIDNCIKKLTDVSVGFVDAVDIFRKQTKKLDVWYFDSIGAKRHEIAVSCTPDMSNEVKSCLIDVFNAHGIELDFIDE